MLHLNPLTSDHLPILLQIRNGPAADFRKRKRFWFEEAWLQLKDCPQIIFEGWTKQVSGMIAYMACEKIKSVRVELLKWKTSFSAIKEEIQKVRDQMKVLFQ